MSKKSKAAYYRDLDQQVTDRLEKMLRAGEGTSKKDAIADGSVAEKIFSYSTYQSYKKHCLYFTKYVKETHPEVRNLRKAKKYVNEWLQKRVDEGGINGEPLSAWTISLERQALCKLYGIRPDSKKFFHAPKRRRADIKRSRTDAVRDKNFSVTNNDELIKFCQGTGLRRSELQNLKGGDLISMRQIESRIWTLESQERRTPEENLKLAMLKDAANFKDIEYFIHVRCGKGGRARLAPIIGPYRDQIVGRMLSRDEDQKVWQHVSSNADIHGYRAEYATAIYRMYARPLDEIPYDRYAPGIGQMYQSDVYCCRKDEKGRRLDRRAMKMASKALGHNRVEIVASNYLRGL